MREPGLNQAFQLGNEQVHAFGRQVQTEEFDGNEAVAFGIVSAKNRPEGTGANLMENPEPSEGIWRCSTRSVGVQLKDSSGKASKS